MNRWTSSQITGSNPAGASTRSTVLDSNALKESLYTEVQI